MKKSKIGIFLAVLTVSIILTVTLTGCSNTPPHKILKDTWLENEVATYDIVRTLLDGDDVATNNPTVKGIQVMTTKRIHNATITVGENPIDNFQGTIVTIDTLMEDGSFMKATFAFSSVMRPQAIARESFVKGYEHNQPSVDTSQTLNAKFNGKSYDYTLKNNAAEPTSGSLPLKKTWEKAPFFDTMQLYHLARSCFTGKKGAFATLQFSVPSYTEGKLKTANVTSVNTNAEIEIAGTKYATTQVAFKYVQKFPGEGKPIYAWYNNGEMAGVGAHALIRFEESNMVYTLKSITA